MSVRVRFAPSPTGFLHVGNVRTALYNWLFARQKQGIFLLRIEDTDVMRSEIQYESQLMNDLKWLGLTWDEGIVSGGNHGPYRQSERLPLYKKYSEKLLAEEKAYYCFCSAQELEDERQQQLSRGEQPRYSGRCRLLNAAESRHRVSRGEPAAIRLKVRGGTVGFNDLVFGPLEVDCATIGDFILMRSEGNAQYNFACVIDDAGMEISHVIRGEGHVSNTHRQILIYEALGLPIPQFVHLSTILGKDGAKLSKRHGSTSIDEFRRQGYLPEALVNYLALLGWAPADEGREILSAEELIREFDLSRVNRSPAVFDPEKLNWVNRSHLKKLDQEQLTRMASEVLANAGLIPLSSSERVFAWVGNVAGAVLNYIDKMEDLPREVKIVFDFDPENALRSPDVAEVLRQESARAVIEAFHEEIRNQEDLNLDSYKKAVEATRRTTGQKGKNLYHPIRVALTARASGPELEKLILIFEEGKKLDLPLRVQGAIERVTKVREHLKQSF